jgi:glycosyltransferase involved in cell wall biosynthesis
LRVAFDGRTLTAPAGGVRRYARELFGAILRVAPETTITAIGAERDATLPDGICRADVRGLLPTNLGWNLTALPLAARRVAYDVFHAPAYGSPLWGVRPLVVTIHDVSYARVPQWYPYHSDPIRRAFYRASARRADRILTDSAFSRDEIVAAFDVDAEGIDVVPLGVGARFAPDARVAREPFVLHVGDLHARRNLSMLLDVVLSLRTTDARCSSLRLVLAGADLGLLDSLRRQAAGAEDALAYVGRPADTGLIDLYRRAAVFAYPSRYEGFGLPLLEAMACDTPVVAGNAASVPEVVGSAAILLPVDDAKGWREAIAVVLTDPARAADLAARGRERARQFTWERTATETLACYRTAQTRHHGGLGGHRRLNPG